MNKTLLLGAMAALAILPAQATLYSASWNSGFVNGTLVPDNDLNGWSDSRTVSSGLGAGSTVIGSLNVNVQLSGGWNGDLYAYLVHDTGFAVLLNQVGTPGLSLGYGDAGMSVSFTDAGTALGNIHTYGGVNMMGGAPTGEWNPDNTGANPGSLASFFGTTVDGTWSLFIADLNSGGVMNVDAWGLDIVAVPEVETWAAAALAGLFGAYWINRRRLARREQTA